MLDKTALLSRVKILLDYDIDDTENDSKLNLLIDDYAEEVADFCNISVDTLPRGLQNIVVELTIWRFKRLGTEGAESEKLGDLSITYEKEIPKRFTQQMYKYRKVKTL